MQENSVLGLALDIASMTHDKVGRIENILRHTEILALNARIEAARAGTAGAAFSVVAQEMSRVSGEIRHIAEEFRGDVASHTQQIQVAGSQMINDFRGQRFTDLAHNAVEIMDRNLYERSCDVRWWATDSALVAAAGNPEQAGSCQLASARLATILRSYTVYLDLWVADAQGRVVASGRADRYPGVLGLDVSGENWFRRAKATASGDDFVVADIARNPALGDAACATYAAAIREEGDVQGAVTGVMGIFFDWTPQAGAVVDGVALAPGERDCSRVMLLDADFRIIADSRGSDDLGEKYPIDPAGRDRGHDLLEDGLVAFARTPGYETYRGLGWYGAIEYREGGQVEPRTEPPARFCTERARHSGLKPELQVRSLARAG